MPNTASLMARALGVPYHPARLTAEPDYNILLGRYYLRRLLDRYDGEAVLAMSAYNAGPSRVQAWLELNGDPRRGDLHDLVDWVELIPFDETRNYVQRVTEARNMYRVRLADPAAARVHFPQVAGPIRPTPTPYLKPREAAYAARYAAITARAPLPQLKPVVETSLTPPAVPLSTPLPAEPPEARRPAGASAPVQAEPSPNAATGQAIAFLARIPEARPALASNDAGEADLAVISTTPELKPDGLTAIKAATPPQPELKPKGP
jgi:soluble lytic murein transglycosylase